MGSNIHSAFYIQLPLLICEIPPRRCVKLRLIHSTVVKDSIVWIYQHVCAHSIHEQVGSHQLGATRSPFLNTPVCGSWWTHGHVSIGTSPGNEIAPSESVFSWGLSRYCQVVSQRDWRAHIHKQQLRGGVAPFPHHLCALWVFPHSGSQIARNHQSCRGHLEVHFLSSA